MQVRRMLASSWPTPMESPRDELQMHRALQPAKTCLFASVHICICACRYCGILLLQNKLKIQQPHSPRRVRIQDLVEKTRIVFFKLSVYLWIVCPCLFLKLSLGNNALFPNSLAYSKSQYRLRKSCSSARMLDIFGFERFPRDDQENEGYFSYFYKECDGDWGLLY